MKKRKKAVVRKKAPTGRKAPARQAPKRVGRGYPPDFKAKLVALVVDSHLSAGRVADTFGISEPTVSKWVAEHRAETEGADQRSGRESADELGMDARHEAVLALKEEHPEYGTRRIRDVMRRFEGLGVSETLVRRVLHEAGLIEPTREPAPARQRPPRRFERAQPNQLWQSDIFTFLLRRHERLYLTVFMDDHSRFIVGHALAHHQKSMLVMEALERGIAAFGTPREVLTDNGRQYTAWRGTTVFEETLRREGIAHIKSRPQHPQTLGKVERFWKTLWDEFLGRTVFADFDDCTRRLKLFIDAYNFQRPHQALGGLVPADRYFRAAPQVREAIERTVADNAMRLAHQRPTVKPFYLVGRMGDRDVSIAADAGGLRVRLGDEQPQRIDLGKEEQHGSEEIPNRLRSSAGPAAQAPETSHAEVALGAEGPGRDGTAPLLDDSERAQRREAHLGPDRRIEDFPRHVLRAGVESADGDGASPHARQSLGRHERRRGLEEAYRGAREEGRAARAGETPSRAALASDSDAGPPGEDGDERGSETRPLGPATLDDAWKEAFEELDRAEDELDRCSDELSDVEELADAEELPEQRFDPHLGWRGRALRWDRKLTGADAPDEGPSAEGDDEPEAAEGTQEHVRPGAYRPEGASRALRPRAEGDDGGSERGRSGPQPGLEPQSLPDADASGSWSAHRSDHPEGAGPTGPLGAGDGARRASEAADEAARDDAERGRDLAPLARCGERGAPGPDESEAQSEKSPQEEDEDDRWRGTGGAGA